MSNSISVERKAYYVAKFKEQTKSLILDVAKEFNLNPSTAYYLNKKAFHDKLIEIEIKFNPPEIIKLETKITQQLKLKDCFIAEIKNKKENTLKAIGSAAAWYLDRFINKAHIVSIGGGNTLNYFVDAFNPLKTNRKESLEICPFYSEIFPSTFSDFLFYPSSFLSHKLAEKLKLKGYHVISNQFQIPPIQNKEEQMQCLVKYPTCKNLLNKIQNSDIVIVGIGSLHQNKESTFKKLLEFVNYSDTEINELTKKGVVGDVINIAISKEGKFFKTKLDDIRFSLEKELLLKLSKVAREKYVIGIAGGENKINAIIGASKAKLINTLITDEITARKLLSLI